MEVSIPTIELSMEEKVLFSWIKAASAKFRDAYKHDFPDLNGETHMEALNFAMVCGGWVRDKVVYYDFSY